jgi:hypothetical protein
LAAVHAQGVVHRDVKPDNLVLDDDATVRVLDFGVALVKDVGTGGFVTQKGVAVGTPHFMAPEQARGATVDARVDAWALGATLFTLLTGKPPFYTRDDEPDLDILARILRERAPDVRSKAPTTSAATAAWISKLLEPDREQRPADLNDVADAFDALADSLARGEVPAAPPSIVPLPDVALLTPTKTTSSSTGLRAMALLGLLVAGAAIAVLVQRMVALSTVVAAPVEDSKPVDVTPVDVKPVDVKPVDVKPVDVKPVDVKPVDVKPDIQAEIRAGGVSGERALRSLLQRSDDEAGTQLRNLVRDPGPVGDLVIDAVADTRSLGHTDLLEVALDDSKGPRALHAIRALLALKTDRSVAALDHAAHRHTDKAVRAAATKARDQLFSVNEP